MNANHKIILGASSLGAVLLGFFFLMSRNDSKEILETLSPPPPASSTAIVESQVRPVPAGAKEYRNNRYGFSFFHPQNLRVEEYQEEGDAVTIVFQDTGRGEGFQLFIQPYADTKISEERFRADVPSGMRAEVEKTNVGGTEAVAFVSQDKLFGDMREVWFIRDGYLYEATTLRPLEKMLSDALLTWRFSE